MKIISLVLADSRGSLVFCFFRILMKIILCLSIFWLSGLVTAFSCVKFPEEAWRKGMLHQFYGQDYALLGYHVSFAENKESIEQFGLKKAGMTRYGEGIYVGYDVEHLLLTYPLWSSQWQHKIVCSVFAPIQRLVAIEWCPLVKSRVWFFNDIKKNAIKGIHKDWAGVKYFGRPRYAVITPDLKDDLVVKCEYVPLHSINSFQPTWKNPIYAELPCKDGTCALNGVPGQQKRNKNLFSS